MQSCFPVIFKYRNGNIDLYHGNHAGLSDAVLRCLNDPELEEIQLFEKGVPINSGKVRGFLANVKQHYSGHPQPPIIHHQPAAGGDDRMSIDYSSAVIYRDEREQPVILVGASESTGGLAFELASCIYPDAELQPYNFQRVAIPRPEVVQMVTDAVTLRRQDSLPDLPQANVNHTNRWHAFEVDASKFNKLKANYKHQKGDHLKTNILNDFKQELMSANSPQDLEQRIAKIKESPEYDVLATGQGLFTKIFGACGLKSTSSVKAFDAIVDECRANQGQAHNDEEHYTNRA